MIMRMSEMPRLQVNPEYSNDTLNSAEAEKTVESLYGDHKPGQKPQTPEMPQKGSVSMKKKMPLVLAGVAIVAGVLTGLGAQRLAAQSGIVPGVTSGPVPLSQVAGEIINNGDVFGVPDEQTFKDSAEGYLQIGGIDGEGSHKLLRPGGDSQTVYLTSSITDLNKFDGMQVKVWGETFKGQQAGWLMDVGRVQVINTQGAAPTEE